MLNTGKEELSCFIRLKGKGEIMPYKQHEITRKYFNIAAAAEILERRTGYVIETSTLRFWEKELSLRIRKNRRGQRRYTEETLSLLQQIATLRYHYQFTNEGIKLLLENKEHADNLSHYLRVNISKHGESK